MEGFRGWVEALGGFLEEKVSLKISRKRQVLTLGSQAGGHRGGCHASSEGACGDDPEETIRR